MSRRHRGGSKVNSGPTRSFVQSFFYFIYLFLFFIFIFFFFSLALLKIPYDSDVHTLHITGLYSTLFLGVLPKVYSAIRYDVIQICWSIGQFQPRGVVFRRSKSKNDRENVT